MRHFLSCLLIAAVLVTSQAASAGELFPRVLVTVAPLKPYVEALLSGVGSVHLLTRSGQDPHVMALSPSQARALAQAEIIVTPGDELNVVLSRQLKEKTRRGALIVVLTELPGADALPYTPRQSWLEDTTSPSRGEVDAEHRVGVAKHESPPSQPSPLEGEGGATDPHIWLDPLRMAAIARPLAEALAQKAPSLRAKLLDNADRLAHHLRAELHPQLKAMLAAAKPGKRYANKQYIPFITYHDAYHYFFARYAIEPQGEILKRPEEYLGAGSLKTMLNTSEKTSIGCIVSESDASLVRRMAELSGARIVSLNPERTYGQMEAPVLNWLTNDYDRLLYRTAAAFAECLGK